MGDFYEVTLSAGEGADAVSRTARFRQGTPGESRAWCKGAIAAATLILGGSDPGRVKAGFEDLLHEDG